MFHERWFTSQDGYSLYFRDYPALEANIPVLCLSGLARNSKDFRLIAPEIASGALGPARRVLCLDYRGRGRSDFDRNPMNYQPATYINDIKHLLASLGLHKVIVLGASLGGLLGMALGAAAPTLLRALVLNDIGPVIGETGLGRIIAYLKSDRRLSDFKAAEQDLRSILTQPGWTDEEWRFATDATYRQEEDGTYRVDWDTRIVAPLLKGAPIPDLRPLFISATPFPMLVFRGEHSDILSEETLASMAERHPDFEQATIPAAGHTPTLSEPFSKEKLHGFLSRF